MSTRENTQEDFDLKRFIEMFDAALTSKDERVINALRSLLMIVTLTAPENDVPVYGPLQRLFDDVYKLSRRIDDLVQEQNRYEYERKYAEKYGRRDWTDDKYTLREEEYNRIAKLINQPSQLAKKEI